MLEFKKVALSDREWMREYFLMMEGATLEYSFTTTILWSKVFHYDAARFGGYLILMSRYNKPAYLFPPGKGELKPVIDAIIEDAKRRGVQPVFYTVLPESKKKLEEIYPGKFNFVLQRANADYVYETQNLITLSGRKLSSKRNHINRFIENNPDWSYEPITKGNIDEAYEMKKEWCRQAECEGEKGLYDESCAVNNAFEHYFDLKLDGGLIRTKGEVIAFSMGDALNENTYLVHIEKAFADIQGAYPMINKQFLIHNCEKFQFVNREDDAGEEGLRKAKLSYIPSFLAEKYRAEYIG